jgi:Domain of unknown function (DUF4136)
MSIVKSLALIAAPLALALGGCATGFPAQVSRFQSLPAPTGQSFYVEAANPANRGGLEFSRYADLVRQNLVAQGYSEAASPQQATLVATLDYGVDNGRQRVVGTPGIRGGLGFGFGRPSFSRFGYFGRRRSPFYWGWYDPFWDDFGPDVTSYTVYHGFVNLTIRRTGDGQSVFEGKAQAQAATNQLQVLVPNLVEALFTNFPGNNGETVRITVPTERTARRR